MKGMAKRTYVGATRLGLLGLGLLCCAGGDDGQLPSEVPEDVPRVVATYPSDGSQDVEPNLVVITARFSEAMYPSGWSWVTEMGRDSPEITAPPFYLDPVTHLLPVKLKSQTTYVLWINSPDDESLRNFESLSGVPARAHRIRFTTR